MHYVVSGFIVSFMMLTRVCFVLFGGYQVQGANTTANNSPPSRIRAFIHQLINHTNNVPQMPNGSKASFAQWGPAIFNSNTTTISPNCYNTARNSSQSQPVHGKQHHFPSKTDNDQKPGTASAFVMVTSTTKNKQIAQ